MFYKDCSEVYPTERDGRPCSVITRSFKTMIKRQTDQNSKVETHRCKQRNKATLPRPRERTGSAYNKYIQSRLHVF